MTRFGWRWHFACEIRGWGCCLDVYRVQPPGRPSFLAFAAEDGVPPALRLDEHPMLGDIYARRVAEAMDSCLPNAAPLVKT